ncbi:MAG: hypothetical protein COC01_02015 [Bacteroidetes bacterium]|nr:MAG: hypothetical protein COC01_02015 [Bacteroidota bacterium]
MQKMLLVFSGISGAVAVVLGALGAHALKVKLSAEAVSSFETGVKYQFYHTIVLVLIALLLFKLESKFINWSAYCFIIGIALFSGSIYLLSTKEITGIEWIWLGPVTPVGGLFFIAGWILLTAAALKFKNV